MNRISRTIAAVALATATLAAPTAAWAGPTGTGPGDQIPPTTLALPDGFAPEGIAIGGHFAYFGSRATGSIFRVDLLTGAGSQLSTGPGTPSLGMTVDSRGRLWVAGGTGGDARVIDTASGRVLASYQFATGAAFINDVVLTPRMAWFTDSTNPVLYGVPRHADGRLATPAEVVRLPITGALVYGTGINANGITRTPDGSALLVVQTNTGGLFRVDPATGASTAVDLGGDTLTDGDGLRLSGRTLFAVQNRLNTLAVLRVARDGRSARVLQRVTDPRFDVPTAVVVFGDRLYLPNARFTTPVTPTTTYTAVAIRRP
jgi:sugar lactone lactonase YvrE